MKKLIIFITAVYLSSSLAQEAKFPLLDEKVAKASNTYSLGEWKKNLDGVNTSQKIPFGMVLSCYGSCRAYSKGASFQLKYKSLIHIGDEVKTDAASYLWVLAYDGSLVRLSERSMFLTLSLIKSKDNKILMGLRLAYGNILYHPRSQSDIKANEIGDSSNLYLPFQDIILNPEAGYLVALEKNKDVKKYQPYQVQFQLINKLIKQVNALRASVPQTQLILSTSTFTLWSQSTTLDVFSVADGKGYYRAREFQQAESFAKVYLHGTADFKSQMVSLNDWYEVDEKGKSSVTPPQVIAPFGDYYLSTQKFSSMRFAREWWLRALDKKMSQPQVASSINDLVVKNLYAIKNYEKKNISQKAESDNNHEEMSLAIEMFNDYASKARNYWSTHGNESSINFDELMKNADRHRRYLKLREDLKIKYGRQ